MSQEQFNKNEKQFPRFQPNRDENNKKGGPKFSSYWVWAILLATVIGFALYGPFAKKYQQITVEDFKSMLLKHHVEKYVEIPNKNIVRVSIKKDSLRYYADKLPTSPISNKKDEKAPQFTFESNERFREEILDFKKENPVAFPPTDFNQSYDPYSVEKDSTWFSGIVSFILPVLLFLAIWVLLMRKMSGGSGSGGGPG